MAGAFSRLSRLVFCAILSHLCFLVQHPLYTPRCWALQTCYTVFSSVAPPLFIWKIPFQPSSFSRNVTSSKRSWALQASLPPCVLTSRCCDDSPACLLMLLTMPGKLWSKRVFPVSSHCVWCLAHSRNYPGTHFLSYFILNKQSVLYPHRIFLLKMESLGWGYNVFSGKLA